LNRNNELPTMTIYTDIYLINFNLSHCFDCCPQMVLK
jgi:hypothetical protein